jgi:hypothetical protein
MAQDRYRRFRQEDQGKNIAALVENPPLYPKYLACTRAGESALAASLCVRQVAA